MSHHHLCFWGHSRMHVRNGRAPLPAEVTTRQMCRVFLIQLQRLCAQGVQGAGPYNKDKRHAGGADRGKTRKIVWNTRMKTTGRPACEYFGSISAQFL